MLGLLRGSTRLQSLCMQTPLPSTYACMSTATSLLPDDGKTLYSFINQTRTGQQPIVDSEPSTSGAARRTVHIETYGCQMNSNDSEVVLSILTQAGFTQTSNAAAADVVLLNTCAIRENAESKIWQRLGYFKNLKQLQHRHNNGGGIQKNRPVSSGTNPSIDANISSNKSEEKLIAQNDEQVQQPQPRRKNQKQVVGVLGCMAERLKHKLIESEKMVDIVAGPDAYRDLPRLIDIVTGSISNNSSYQQQQDEGVVEDSNNNNTTTGKQQPARAKTAVIQHKKGRLSAINVQLSLDETYADVVPVRPAGARSAFLSIMRGCNNMCAFCVVPFTRGRERSRPMHSILDEVKMLSDQGVKEITLLGQNVNSYTDFTTLPSPSPTPQPHHNNSPPLDDLLFAQHYAKGFKSIYKPHRSNATSFADLLHNVASINPEIRIRYTSPHPKDFSDDVLSVVAAHHNICKQLHMPAQSGSSSVLAAMKRGYTREAYDELVTHVRRVLPGVALSTDMIAGFCGETEKDHQESVDLMKQVGYELAFLFAYSERSPTFASKHLQDDVPEEVKGRRLRELIEVYRAGLVESAKKEVGRRHLVLVEGVSRRDEKLLTGRSDTFKRIVFQNIRVLDSYKGGGSSRTSLNGVDDGTSGISTTLLNGAAGKKVAIQPGDYVAVQITEATGGTMVGDVLARTSIAEFVGVHGSAVPLETYA